MQRERRREVDGGSRDEQVVAQQDKSFAESVLAQQVAAQSADNPSAQKQLADMQSELSALLAKYTEDHPDVIRLRQSIADLKQKMASSGVQGASQGATASAAGV